MCHAGAWTEGRLAVFRTEDPENFIFFPGCGTMMEDRKSRRSAYAGTWTDRVFPFRREEASRLIATLAGAGDTVLFENDLPDNYSE